MAHLRPSPSVSTVDYESDRAVGLSPPNGEVLGLEIGYAVRAGNRDDGFSNCKSQISRRRAFRKNGCHSHFAFATGDSSILACIAAGPMTISPVPGRVIALGAANAPNAVGAPFAPAIRENSESAFANGAPVPDDGSFDET